MEITEIMGWIGNVLVITQFLQKDMLKLRIYGVLGGAIWLAVAVMMNSISLAVLNFIIIGIQLYHIRKLIKEKLSFILTEDEYEHINYYLEFLIRKMKLKVCGLSNTEEVKTCVSLGVDYCGFILNYQKSYGTQLFM